jgi:hypothetical protein
MMRTLLRAGYDAEVSDDPQELHRNIWHYAAGALQRAALEMLCSEEFKSTVVEHINCTDRLGRTPLHYALLNSAAVKDAWAAEPIERRKSTINQIQRSNKSGLNRLKSAGSVWKVSNRVKGVDLVQEERIYACARLLIEAGATVGCVIPKQINCHRRVCKTATLQAGFTPLHFAAAAGQQKLVQLLCEHHANASLPDSLSRTPLHLACWAGSHEAVKILLKYDSDPGLRNGAGRTPIAVASVYGHIGAIRAVLEYSKHPVDIDEPNHKGETPLLLAVQDQFFSCAAQMVELGANPFLRDDLGRSAIVLCVKGCPEIVLKVLDGRRHPSDSQLYGHQLDVLYDFKHLDDVCT